MEKVREREEGGSRDQHLSPLSSLSFTRPILQCGIVSTTSELKRDSVAPPSLWEGCHLIEHTKEEAFYNAHFSLITILRFVLMQSIIYGISLETWVSRAARSPLSRIRQPGRHKPRWSDLAGASEEAVGPKKGTRF